MDIMEDQTLKKQLSYIVPEFRLALIKESKVDSCPLYINIPSDIGKFVEPLKYASEEHFVSFHLTAKCQVIGYHVVSRGTLSEAIIHAREIFKTAMLANSSSIILAHNHPSGQVMPSNEDYTTTETLVKIGDWLGIPVIDHVIISPHGGTYSFRENHANLWADNEAGNPLRLKE